MGQGEVGGVTCRVNAHSGYVVADCRNGLVGTEWTNSSLDCTNMVRKWLLSTSYMAMKVDWAQNRCLLAENANSKVINEWAWLGSRVCVM